MQQKIVTNIEGVDVADYKSFPLTTNKFININYQQYPQKYSHILIHAIQFQQPIPSIKSMQRTQKRNKAKAQGGQPATAKKGKRSGHGRKRVPRNLARQDSSNLVKPQTPKEAKTFKVRSPEWIALKAARQQCQVQLKNCFQPKENEDEKKESKQVKSELPIYFKKKNKSHWRRIKQRKALIKANKDKLVEMYGFEILNKDCRLGIKDIKRILGLVEGGMEEQAVGEFMIMVNGRVESVSSGESSSEYSYSQSSSS